MGISVNLKLELEECDDGKKNEMLDLGVEEHVATLFN